MSLKLNVNHALSFIDEKEWILAKQKVMKAHDTLHQRNGLGNEFLGWLDLPNHMDESLITSIETVATGLRAKANVLVVIGIGGSYLGAKAALDFLSPYFESPKTDIVFAGHHMSGDYLSELLVYLENKEFALNVISKSGTTTEPALAFRMLKKALEAKYGKDEAKTRIVATTDESKGALRTLADEEGYTTFVIPDDIGGRFSVLTPVGLLPLAVAGIDIRDIIKGAKKASKAYRNPSIEENPAYHYAAIRNALYASGKKIEMMVDYEPKLAGLIEWWKQLFGESEGKDGLGIFVASAHFSTDLHSLGQYIQDGERHLFETILLIEEPKYDVFIEKQEKNLDGLNDLEGKTIDWVNKQAFKGTLLAHVEGGVPNVVLTMPKTDAKTFGELVYFFMVACAVSAYALGVNPFNQPGVEAYKQNMYALLGKPGYENLRERLLLKLSEDA